MWVNLSEVPGGSNFCFDASCGFIPGFMRAFCNENQWSFGFKIMVVCLECFYAISFLCLHLLCHHNQVSNGGLIKVNGFGDWFLLLGFRPRKGVPLCVVLP